MWRGVENELVPVGRCDPFAVARQGWRFWKLGCAQEAVEVHPRLSFLIASLVMAAVWRVERYYWAASRS